MTLYKQKNSPYWYFNISINGKRKRISTKTTDKSLAREIEKTRKIQLRKEEEGLSQKQVFLNDLFSSYINNALHSLNENTQRDYLHWIDEFHTFLGNKLIDDNLVIDIQGFVENLFKIQKEKNYSPAYINRPISYLSSIFNYGVRIKLIRKNYISEIISSRYLPKEKERVRYLTKNEYQGLLENCSYELLKQAIILAVETGLRKKELMSLRWIGDQIDFLNREITVWFTKNKKHRTIPISPGALEILKKMYENKIEYEVLTNKTCEYVFFNFNTEKRVKSFKKSFNTAKRKAKIEDLHWHDLRHTFATWALKGWFSWQKYPMDLYKLQKWLGHKDIKTTQRYAHYETKDLHSGIVGYNYEY